MPRRKKGPPEDVNPNVNPASLDETTPDRGPPFPIVAIGASAGGIEATAALLRALPADTGMAYVIVQHLSPTHESMLAGILARSTSMNVSEVTHDIAIEPDRVYVIPPNKHLSLAAG